MLYAHDCSCRKCEVQYVGETSQTLRGTFNNHRNRLKQLCGLYLYHHFNSDNHSLDDINIVPIEEVVLEQTDGTTLPIVYSLFTLSWPHTSR